MTAARRRVRRPRRPVGEVTVLVRLPPTAVRALDEHVKSLQGEGVAASRATAARSLLDLALRRESTTTRLLVLRYRIVAWILETAGPSRTIAVARLRERFSEVARGVLDRTLLDLEAEGVVSLERGPSGGGVHDARRGELAVVRVLRKPR